MRRAKLTIVGIPIGLPLLQNKSLTFVWTYWCTCSVTLHDIRNVNFQFAILVQDEGYCNQGSPAALVVMNDFSVCSPKFFILNMWLPHDHLVTGNLLQFVKKSLYLITADRAKNYSTILERHNSVSIL